MVPGETLGRYTVLGKLATGGMAEVLLARQDGPQGFAKTVVLKRIRANLADDDHFIRMFLDEARLAALINHPNIVSIYELGEDTAAGAFFISMEYIDGCTVRRLVHQLTRRSLSLSFAMIARLMADAAAGLDFAHNIKDQDQRLLGLIHRDVSPENILITYSGQVKVVDFGIAKASLLEGTTAAGQVKGKFSYMAPEQLLGAHVDRRADIWALGVTLYWLCCGMKPYRGDTDGDLVQRIIELEPTPLRELRPDVPEGLAAIAHRALRKAPAERFQTARAFQDGLETWMQRSGQTANSGKIADLMEMVFPEDIDPDRVARHSLLVGQVPQHGPSETSLYPKPHASLRPVSSGGTQRRSHRSLLMSGGAGLAAVIATSAVALRPWRTRPAEVAPAAQAAAVPPTEPAEASPARTVPPDAPAPAIAPLPQAPAPQRRTGTAHAERPVGGGLLAVRVQPWATVYIDGERVGTTPFVPVKLAAGSHRVRLINEDFKVAREMTVAIQSGRTTKLRARLTENGSAGD